ncbi:MAG: phosphate-binding protein, partial [Halomonas aquamarina]
VYIDAGENDNLIVQRLAEDTGAFGIFGYSFLVENPDTIMGATIGGVEPEVEAISSGEYPVARSLWFYLKNQHADEVTPMYEYANMFMEDQMIGEDGYLVDLGLIPLPEAEREQARQKVADRVKLVAADLE